MTIAKQLLELYDGQELRNQCVKRYTFYSRTLDGEHFRFKDDSYLVFKRN